MSVLNNKPNYTATEQTSPQFAFTGARQPERIAIQIDEFDATTKIAKFTPIGMSANALKSLEITGRDIYGANPTRETVIGEFNVATPAQITVDFSDFDAAAEKIQLHLNGYSSTLDRYPNQGSQKFDFQTAVTVPYILFDYRVQA
jgi:hypothetical protein